MPMIRDPATGELRYWNTDDGDNVVPVNNAVGKDFEFKDAADRQLIEQRNWNFQINTVKDQYLNYEITNPKIVKTQRTIRTRPRW